MILEIKNLSCGYDSHEIVKNVSFSVASGEICCLLGPNGVGKTTLFRSILGFIKVLGGEILLDHKDISQIPKRKLAQSIAYVPQAHTPPFSFKVIEVVTMGRTAYLGAFSSPTEKDRKIANEALKTLDIEYLKDKVYTEISGGERQMVLIARALAQEPEFLIMDEPTANLDFGNQVHVMKRVNQLSKSGIGILMTTHFPDHVFQCDCNVALLKRQHQFVFGKAETVVTEKSLFETYGIEVKIMDFVAQNHKFRTCTPIII